MDARFLDMLHHPGDDDVAAVADRVDVDLDRVAQILVDEHRAVAGDLDRGDDIIVELGRPVDGACPEGQVYRRSGEMMHVWFTDDLATAFARRAPLAALRAANA